MPTGFWVNYTFLTFYGCVCVNIADASWGEQFEVFFHDNDLVTTAAGQCHIIVPCFCNPSGFESTLAEYFHDRMFSSCSFTESFQLECELLNVKCHTH